MKLVELIKQETGRDFKTDFDALQFYNEQFGYLGKKIAYRLEKYNGWTNYATWRVMLELVDPVHYEKSECDKEFSSVYELSEAIKQDIELYLGDEAGGGAGGGTCYDYAMAFISDVNWYEIAVNIASDNKNIIVLEDK